MPVTPQESLEFLQRRERERRARARALWCRADADARGIIRMIASDHHVARIWQWGSILHPDQFREGSDIDLALEGVGGAAEFFAIHRAAESLTEFPIDLVELEKIEPEFADIIRMKGKVVHER